MKLNLSMKRLSMLFLAIFSVLVAGVFVFERFWADPGKRCEAKGDWYDMSTRTCATPIYIPDITGRAEGVSREEASREGLRNLIELEAQIAERDRAIKAATEAERRAYREAQRKD